MNCAVHLERPAVQPCDRCGNFSCPECLAPVGSQHMCGSCRVRASELEWDRRKELGLFRAWWLTTKRMVFNPLQTLDVISPDGSIVESSIYATICVLVGVIPTMLVYGLFFGVMMAVGPGTSGADTRIGWAAGTGIGFGVAIFYLVFFIVMSVGFLLLSAALELVVLRMGGTKEARYSVAVRAHALSMAAYIAGVVPLCSIYVYPVWALVLRVFAIHKLQRTTAGAGVAAALIPLGLCCFSIFSMYAVIFAVAGLANNR